MQNIIYTTNGYDVLNDFFERNHKVLLVCGNSFEKLKIHDYFETVSKCGVEIVRFSDFQPNPLYESVEKGVDIFCKEKCKAIVAVGGGSAIDVAKCIKLYSNMDHNQNYLEQEIVPNDVEFMAIPTTAGTGSEATRFAVIYYNGEKQSVAHDSCIPSTAVFDYSTVDSLPLYQKKVTVLDALCHAVESFWSVNSTEESQNYSRKAISLILNHFDDYLSGKEGTGELLLKASNYAGKAINITQTTAGHAMSYKLTSLYGIAHGQAAALCVEKLWPFMIENTGKCTDSRGAKYLDKTFEELAELFGDKTKGEGPKAFSKILEKLDFEPIRVLDPNEYEILKSSVNTTRLKNNPVALSVQEIDTIYHQILGEKKDEN